MDYYQLKLLVEEKIQKNNFVIINSALKQFILKHKYDKDCQCDLCNCTNKILELKLKLHKVNKIHKMYYDFAPISTIVKNKEIIEFLESAIYNEKFEKTLIELNNLNKINVCTEHQKKSS
jgi:hypothetical protein